MIPKKIHFVFGLEEGFGGKEFCFAHWAAIKSAKVVNPDYEIHYWYKYLPDNYYFNSLIDDLILHEVEPPEEIFGNRLYHVAHKADVLRLMALKQFGGIYLDIDTICVSSFDPLLSNNFVMGYEKTESLGVVGLCNAVMMSEIDADFVNIWIEQFRNFRSKGRDEYWAELSVKVPFALSKEYPELITILENDAFFYPDWSNEGIAKMFYHEIDFKNAYAHHLWESLSWGAMTLINEFNFIHIKNSYTKIIGRVLEKEIDLLRLVRNNWISDEIDGKQARLNLGCGTKRKIKMINCDMYPSTAADITFDLEENNWPIPDASVVEVELSSVLEHIRNSTIFFKELYRVCAHGAKINITVPHPRHDWFLMDPTHVKPWHPESFLHLDLDRCLQWYFSGDSKTPLAVYWKIDFKIIEMKITPENNSVQGEIDTLFSRDGVDLNLANKYLNNVAADLQVVLMANKVERS